MFGIGTLCIRILLLADLVVHSSTRASTQDFSARVQPTKNLLFILRIYFPHFWFWIDFPRPLLAFPSPLKEVGILYICLYLVVLLSSLVPYRADVWVQFF